MNDDPSPSSATRAGRSADANLDVDGNDRAPTPEHPLVARYDTTSRENRQDGRRRRRKPRKKRTPGLKKKLAFVTHLLKGLDTLVFAELSALYYMECSLFRFLIRAFSQFMYLSPKDEAFPFHITLSRLHVGLIVVSNVWCILVHLFAALPVGLDFHRGYMHGGLIIDFVGQKPPTWRIYYLFADVVLFALQCVMVSVQIEREKLRVALKTFRPLFPELTPTLGGARTIEELDAEERDINGVGGASGSRDQDLDLDPDQADDRSRLGATQNQDGDIELQPLRRARNRRFGPDRSEDSDLPSNTGEETSRSHLSDILNSGNAMVGEYHVINSVLSAFNANPGTQHANSLRSIGYEATMAALDARRRRAYMEIPSRQQGGAS